jgi:hypothetical protein
MATTRSQFIIKHYEGFGGNFVDSQYLAASYETGKPHMFNNTLMKVYSAQNRFFTGKPLLGMTGAKSFGKVEIDTEVFRWKLQGAEEKCARVVTNVEASNTTPGLNNSTFRVKLDLDYYAEPDVLLPEDNDFPCEIIGDPIQDGTGYIYVLRLQGDDPTSVLPAYLLEPGREWSKGWTSTQSEYNKKFGTQQVPASFMLESQVGAFAQKFTVTDKAMRDEGRLEVEFLVTDPKSGKETKVSRFMPMYEAKMHDELYMSMEVQYHLGRKQTRPGHDGYWKKTGPGLRQQLADSWIEYYNGPLTTSRLKDYLLSIFFSRENEQNRKVVAMTGTLGSMIFHDMLASEASSFFTIDTNFVQQISKNPRHLSFGAQFTHYQGPEGIEVTLIKNPLYDSRKYCKRMHPLYPEFPIDSGRMTFLDFGTSEGRNNITMVSVKDTYRYGYTVGTVGPMGPVKGGQAGALIAGYDMFVEGTGGIWMVDVTRGGELIYDAEF